jgi:hypothetical protein
MSTDKNKLIPELRFPEFIDTEPWKEENLQKVADYENGKAHEQDIDEKGKYVVVNSKFISTDGEVRKFSNTANCIAKKNEILMSCTTSLSLKNNYIRYFLNSFFVFCKLSLNLFKLNFKTIIILFSM